MQQQRRSPSMRKFLRREKARIRREVPDQKEAESKIREVTVSLHAA